MARAEVARRTRLKNCILVMFGLWEIEIDSQEARRVICSSGCEEVGCLVAARGLMERGVLDDDLVS
jgi:hypothetical protein